MTKGLAARERGFNTIGEAWQGAARRGAARLGAARQGKEFTRTNSGLTELES